MRRFMRKDEIPITTSTNRNSTSSSPTSTTVTASPEPSMLYSSTNAAAPPPPPPPSLYHHDHDQEKQDFSGRNPVVASLLSTGVVTTTSTTATSTIQHLPSPSSASSMGPSSSSSSSSSSTSSHPPYSAIALSPDRTMAVAASRDTLSILRIDSSVGLILVKTMTIAQHFQIMGNSSTASTSSSTSGQPGGGTPTTTRTSVLQQAFGLGPLSSSTSSSTNKSTSTSSTPPQSSTNAMINVVITDVAWSPVQLHHHDQQYHHLQDMTEDNSSNNNNNSSNTSTLDPLATGISSISSTSSSSYSFIAAAGSNGLIVIWNADQLIQLHQHQDHSATTTTTTAAATTTTTTSSMVAPPPEVVLSQHARAVNRLCWHPIRPGLLLSGSQDGKAILWERSKTIPTIVATSSAVAATAAGEGGGGMGRMSSTGGGGGGGHRFNRFFGGGSHNSSSNTTKINNNGGSTTTAVNNRGASTTTAVNNRGASTTTTTRSFTWHCRTTFEPKNDAIRDIQWSPYFEDVFALVTSSGLLIVYNIFLPKRAMVKLSAHSGDATTLDWHPLKRGIIATGGAGDRCVKIWNLEMELSMDKDDVYMNTNSNTLTSRADSVNTEGSTDNENSFPSSSIGHPQSTRTTSSGISNASRHRGNPRNMLHVLSISASVTRLRWRPPANDTFPLEDEDRHESMIAVATTKGASAGGTSVLALWSYYRPFMPLSVVEGHQEGAVTDFQWLETPRKEWTLHSKQRKSASTPSPKRSRSPSRLPGSSAHEVDAILYDNYSDDEMMDSELVGIWQHVVSVGRDGRCLIQSFARGDRPISRVPPSCFAMANLSPFQAGYGSLQLFSLSQSVPSGYKSEFFLTGLRRDQLTASADGVFREIPSQNDLDALSSFIPDDWIGARRYPSRSPQLVFNVVDQGDLDDESKPVDDGLQKGIRVSPELMHFSRFASRYKLYTDERLSTRVDLCQHNANVAENLRCDNLGRMWRLIASMLYGSDMDELPGKESMPENAMQFIIIPTVRDILIERAHSGDVQTCVALCEVLGVVSSDSTLRIPDLEISLVREWYLSYIDILRDMCLFSHATYLIRSCRDPFISAMNQQSTTIHESCPNCGKIISPADTVSGSWDDTNARRVCKSCRRRVGLCFLCHAPVTGIYVWCSGCQHGGHLEHALQWFGGLSGKPVREQCPTGCGHRCNMLQQLTSFPRTSSAQDLAGPELEF